MKTTTKNNLPFWSLLGKLIAYSPKLYVLDALFWFFIMGLAIIPRLIIQAFFNQLTGESQINGSPLVLIGLLLAGGLGRIIAIILGRITKTQHRFLMSSLVRRNLFAELLKKPGAEPLNVHGEAKTTATGEILSYFREDAKQIEDNVVWTNEIFSDGIRVIASLIILLIVNPRLTLLVFLPISAIAIVIQQAEKRLKKYYRSGCQSTQKVTGLIGEIFASVQAIQVASAENYILNNFQKLNQKRHQKMVQDQVFTTAIESLLENLTTIGTGLILVVVAFSISQGIEPIKVGNFALFVYYLAFITDFFWSLGAFLAISKQTEVAMERISSLFNFNANTIVAHHSLYLPPIGGHKPPLPRIYQSTEQSSLEQLTVSNLTYQYPNSVEEFLILTSP